MIFVAIFLAMLSKDILGTGVITFLGKGKVWLAGVCDSLGDLAALFCVGITGAQVLHHGLTVWTLEAVIGLTAGSMLGTVVGARLSNELCLRTLHASTRTDILPDVLTCTVLEQDRPGSAVVILANDPENKYRLTVHARPGKPLLYEISRLEN